MINWESVMQKLYEWILQSQDALLIDLSKFFFLTSDIKKFGKIHQLCKNSTLNLVTLPRLSVIEN